MSEDIKPHSSELVCMDFTEEDEVVVPDLQPLEMFNTKVSSRKKRKGITDHQAPKRKRKFLGVKSNELQASELVCTDFNEEDKVAVTDLQPLEAFNTKVSSRTKCKGITDHQASRRKRKFLGMKSHELHAILQSDPFKFCRDNGLISSSVTCYCGDQMHVETRKDTVDKLRWVCRKGSEHYTTLTLRKGSWFENSRLSFRDICWIAYMWIHEYSYNSMLHEMDQTAITLLEWCSSCRDACQLILESKSDPIGGDTKLVEIFECRFVEKGKSKKGNRVSVKDSKDQWVFCALEQFSTKSVLVIVQDKKSETIVELFSKYILPGTTVFTHIWNAYKDMRTKDFNYLTKERLIEFHDSTTKSDIETIDDFWEVCERPPPGLNGWNKFEYDSQFCEFMYRKSLAFAPDAYLAFLKDLASIYKPQDKLFKKETKE